MYSATGTILSICSCEGEKETGYSYSQYVCSLCPSKGKANLVDCEDCNAPTHTTWLGCNPHAYPGGIFVRVPNVCCCPPT